MILVKTISILVYGKVQGVFFRQSTRDEALRNGITGTVRNEDDGTVHITASGEPEQLENFISWCKTGPSKAKVERIEVREISFQPFRTFMIERF